MKTLTPMLAVGGSTLSGLDWLAIAAYFAILLCVAWWVVSRRKDTAADYFLAGRNLSWWIIGASIFASNIGSEHIVGLAGSGAKDGVALAHYELHAWCLLVLAWVFVPFYARSLVFTMPEFLEKRFCTKSRYVLSISSLLTFIVSKIAVGIFAGGVVFGTLLPELHLDLGGVRIDSFWIGSIAVIVLTGLYTMLGGMRAVAYNDAVQVVVLIGGSALLTIYGLVKLGGWSELKAICGSDMFNLWKPLVPVGQEATWAPIKQLDASGNIIRQAWYFNGNFPWLGMAICAPVIGLWYCSISFSARWVRPMKRWRARAASSPPS
jgi:solute:Na+ symporter, SSS family